MQYRHVRIATFGLVALSFGPGSRPAAQQPRAAVAEKSNIELVGFDDLQARSAYQPHKNWRECETGIAYLVSGAPGWRTDRMTPIFDLSEPAHPVLIRDFGLPGSARSVANLPLR